MWQKRHLAHYLIQEVLIGGIELTRMRVVVHDTARGD